MNKNESKYFNTAVLMDKAFFEILEKKDFAFITVKEICEKAGVNRSTFYLHYENMADLLAESTRYMFEQFQDYIKIDAESVISRLRTCPLEELYLITPEYLTPYLNYIKGHKRLFGTAIEKAAVLQMEDTYSRMFRYVFTPILERFNVPPAKRSYIMSFYIHGLIAVISQWLKNDCNESIEFIISIMQNCVIRYDKTKEKI